jgi:hypothetical protein
MRQHLATLLLLLIIAGCATRPPPAPEPGARPSPPPALLSPIHRDLSDLEMVWHVRAGLNVAALSCSSRVGSGVIADYNGFLRGKQALLTAAYEAKADRFRAQGGNWQRALDTHMTQLYNHFAETADQSTYCVVAATELKRAAALDSDAFLADAGNSLARLDRPFLSQTRTAAMPATRALPAVARAPVVAAGLPGPGWGVQLGAFGSRARAETAWSDVKGRSAHLATFQPHYEPAPGTGLVRLQVKGLTAKADAIELCAHAAAAGFECLPIPMR